MRIEGLKQSDRGYMHPSSVDQDDISSISIDCLVYKVAEYGGNSVFNDKQFMLCLQMSTWDE